MNAGSKGKVISTGDLLKFDIETLFEAPDIMAGSIGDLRLLGEWCDYMII